MGLKAVFVVVIVGECGGYVLLLILGAWGDCMAGQKWLMLDNGTWKTGEKLVTQPCSCFVLSVGDVLRPATAKCEPHAHVDRYNN